jgi:hypothetical protein
MSPLGRGPSTRTGTQIDSQKVARFIGSLFGTALREAYAPTSNVSERAAIVAFIRQAIAIAEGNNGVGPLIVPTLHQLANAIEAGRHLHTRP